MRKPGQAIRRNITKEGAIVTKGTESFEESQKKFHGRLNPAGGLKWSLKKVLYFFLLIVGLMVNPSFTWAGKLLEDLNGDTLIEAIQSVDQVKKAIKRSIEGINECQAGSCYNSRSRQICEMVAALDVKINGLIINEMKTLGKTGLPISENDLALMLQIFQQCRPTNYQYWQYPYLLHVIYSPLPQADQQIRKLLGIKPKKDIKKGKDPDA
jgi:hypothetical protein